MPNKINANNTADNSRGKYAVRHETKQGRGILHDKGGAQGVYEVSFVFHLNTRMVQKLGVTKVEKKMVIDADIQSVNGSILRNGLYTLEEDGVLLYELEKSGISWRVVG